MKEVKHFPKHWKGLTNAHNVFAKSKKEELPRECLSKTQFLKRRKAETAAIKYNMRSYLCPHCRYFHLTSK